MITTNRETFVFPGPFDDYSTLLFTIHNQLNRIAVFQLSQLDCQCKWFTWSPKEGILRHGEMVNILVSLLPVDSKLLPSLLSQSFKPFQLIVYTDDQFVNVTQTLEIAKSACPQVKEVYKKTYEVSIDKKAYEEAKRNDAKELKLRPMPLKILPREKLQFGGKGFFASFSESILLQSPLLPVGRRIVFQVMADLERYIYVPSSGFLEPNLGNTFQLIAFKPMYKCLGTQEERTKDYIVIGAALVDDSKVDDVATAIKVSKDKNKWTHFKVSTEFNEANLKSAFKASGANKLANEMALKVPTTKLKLDLNKDNFMCDLKISNPTDRPIAFELLCNSSLLIYWAPKMDILTPGKELSIHIHRRTMNEENKERLLTMLPPGKMQFLIKAAYTPPGEEKPEKWLHVAKHDGSLMRTSIQLCLDKKHQATRQSRENALPTLAACEYAAAFSEIPLVGLSPLLATGIPFQLDKISQSTFLAEFALFNETVYPIALRLLTKNPIFKFDRFPTILQPNASIVFNISCEAQKLKDSSLGHRFNLEATYMVDLNDPYPIDNARKLKGKLMKCSILSNFDWDGNLTSSASGSPNIQTTTVTETENGSPFVPDTTSATGGKNPFLNRQTTTQSVNGTTSLTADQNSKHRRNKKKKKKKKATKG